MNSYKNGWNLEFLTLLQPSVCYAAKQFRHTDFSTIFRPYKGGFLKNILSKSSYSPFFKVQVEFTFSFDHPKVNLK